MAVLISLKLIDIGYNFWVTGLLIIGSPVIFVFLMEISSNINSQKGDIVRVILLVLCNKY